MPRIGIGLINIIPNNILPIKDYDNNIYTSIIINGLVWLKENFKCTHYINGDSILNLADGDDWINDTEGGYCWVNNDISTKNILGALYNGRAVNHPSGLGITGWRIATKADYENLTTYLGGLSVAGKLKETGTTYWTTPNLGAENAYGFALRGNGTRQIFGGALFISQNEQGNIWTSTVSTPGVSNYRIQLLYDSIVGDISIVNNDWGSAVRLVKDV